MEPPCGTTDERAPPGSWIPAVERSSVVFAHLITWPSEELSGCSSGVCAVTSTVWLTSPTCSAISIFEVLWVSTVTGERRMRLKPGFALLRCIVLARRSRNWYSPSPLVGWVRFALVPSLLRLLRYRDRRTGESATVPTTEPK